MSEDTIIIKAPAGTKARWVKMAGGQKLSDWVLRAVDKPANKYTDQPCPRCSSVVLTYDGGDWLCAQCGLVR